MARKTVTKSVKKSVTKSVKATPKWVVGKNTATCESAQEEYCSCRCRGALHGQPHPPNWKDAYPAFTSEEKKVNKRNALNKWREAHREYVNAYMKSWRVTRPLAPKEEDKDTDD